MKQEILKIADALMALHTDGEDACRKVSLYNALVRLSRKQK